MKQFIATFKHDAGTVKIRVIASNEAEAKKLICNAENCPESAIIRIREAMYYKKNGTVIAPYVKYNYIIN